MIKVTKIPSILVGLRLIIAPLLLIDSMDSQISNWFLIGYIIAVMSDIFDGIIARRLGISTVKLRQADSWADVCLYVCVGISAWLIYPEVILGFQKPLLLAIVAQITLFSISLIKFKKSPSFHTYTAKIWGISLLIATVALFGFQYSQALWLAIVFCLINTIEEIIMILLLPEWKCDILSVIHVWNLRQIQIKNSN